MKSNRKMLKLTRGSPEMAERTKKDGFRMFNLIVLPMVLPEMIQQHRQKNEPEIRQCYKCFSFEHYTNGCKETQRGERLEGKIHRIAK